MSTAPGVGVEFAGYSIERLLGRGGGGLVYLAKDLRLSRHVALKILSSEFADDPRFRERFVRESRLAASIDHHNIIPIYAADEVDGVLFIAMRYVAGTDLRKLLVDEGPIDADRAVEIVGQVADALDAAHAQGLVHRDVKPGNVLIVPRISRRAVDHAYLADFGITKHLTTDHSLTGAGQFVGTTDYVAPEQIMGGAIDGRADIYSLACVFYQCLAGVPPFERDSDVAIIYAHLSDERPRLSSKRPGLPPGMDGVIATGMAKAPADRYPTAGEFITAARAALQESGAPTAVSPRAAPTLPADRPAAVPVVEAPPQTNDAATQTAAQLAPPAPVSPPPPASVRPSPPVPAPVPARATVPPSPPAAPAPAAPNPARRVAVIAAVLVIACLGGVLVFVVTQHHNPSSSATTGHASTSTQTAGLQTMLLTTGDFPAGSVSTLPASLRLSQVRCGATPRSEVDERAVAFQNQNASSGSGYFYFQAAASFNTAADANLYMQDIKLAVLNCTSQLARRAAPLLGDQTVRVTFPSGDGRIAYDAVYLSKGKYVSLVMVSALGTTLPPTTEAETYASTALRHMVDAGA